MLAHSRTINFFLLVTIAILCVLLCFKSCNSNYGEFATIKTEARIDTLKQTIIKYKDSIRVKTVYQERIVTKWREVRYDSLIPCETKLLVADTVIQADSALIFAQRLLINVQGEIIAGQDTVITGLKPCQIFFVGADVTSKGNVFPGIGFDTKRGLFMAGYDPFNKAVKVGAYFKIKGWKRKN